MIYIYKLNTTTITDEQGHSHTTYGIEAYESGASIPTRVISDIFLDRRAAEMFVNACTVLSLDINQLDDVIADVICV